MAKSSVGKIIALAIIAGLAIIGASIGIGVGIKRPEKTYSIEVVSTVEDAQIQGEGAYKLGDTVTLEAGDVDGYRFIEWKFGTAHMSQETPYSFKLTKNNAGTYTAVYGKEYTITKADVENGGFNVSINKAINNEEVTITVTPDVNYQLDRIYYIEQGSEEEHDIENLKFNMPEANVMVYVIFASV